MYILGIDPGTGRTGWGIIRHDGDEKVSYVAHGCVVTSQEEPMHRRLRTLYTSLQEIVNNHKPDIIVIEQIFFGINSRTAMSVSQARGVMLLLCAQENLQFFEYTPVSVKLLVAGSGKTEKKEMQKVVRRLLSKNERTLSFSAKDKAFDDAADGLAIAIHHAWKSIGKTVEKEVKKVKQSARTVKKKHAKI
ncbi:MAG: crossover junction endodeoxyribonuclease RuvC [Candidatus Levyibacteriota bacterium]